MNLNEREVHKMYQSNFVSLSKSTGRKMCPVYDVSNVVAAVNSSYS